MDRRLNFALAFILTLLICDYVKAQLSFKSEFYSTENGLSHDAVTTIIKDREGFFWIGTWNGINRFDGHHFKSFKSFPGDLSHLKNDRIDQIVEDNFKNLWIKAYDNQIYRFDKVNGQFYPFQTGPGTKILFSRIKVGSGGEIWLITRNNGVIVVPDPRKPERFVHYTHDPSSEINLPSDKLNFVAQDALKNIWISTDKGISCLKKTANGFREVKLDLRVFTPENFYSYTENSTRIYFGSGKGNLITIEKSRGTAVKKKISSFEINNLLAAKNGNDLYATTSGGELFVIRSTKEKQAVARFTAGEKLSRMYEDRAGLLWIEPEYNGVVRFDPVTTRFKKITSVSDDGYSYNGTYFRAFEDIKGRVWVCMKNSGLGYFEGDKTHFKPFNNSKSPSQDNLPNAVTALYYENNGVIWFSSVDRGVNKVVLQDDYFKQRFPNPKTTQKSDNEVRGIFVDRDNRLWLGQKSKNLYVLKDGNRVPIKFTNYSDLTLGAVYCILGDSKGNIWLGTKANGLYQAKPLNAEKTVYGLTHYTKGGSGGTSISSNEIYSLLEDNHGKIWVGTFDEGLNVGTEQNGVMKFLNRSNGLKGYPTEGFDKIRNMALDGKGNIWIATTNGLVVKEPGSQKLPGLAFAHYSKIPGVKQSLGNNDIQFVFRDHHNIMWLCTSGGGIDKAIVADPFKKINFRNYTTLDGLPNDYVLSCIEDHRGFIWVATQNGLSKFDPEKAEFTNFGVHDGLPKVSFSESASQHFSDHSIVFGTNRGYIYFHPDSVKDDRSSSKMVFTNLQVNNVDQFPVEDGIINADVNYLQKLVLDYDQNIISIDYTVLDSKKGGKQLYAYRLQGFETKWTNNREGLRATYTNLPPGEYVFEVKSLSNGFVEQLPYKRLEIKILPPLWKTWWAYIIYLILFVGLIEIARRIIMTVLGLKNKIAIDQKLAELKSNFFTNISHELRTPLTLILNPIEEIGRNETLSQQGTDQIEIVKKNSNRMIRFINQLLDLRKLESGKANLKVSQFDLLIFIREVFAYFSQTAVMKNITLALHADHPEVMVWADREKLDIVVYNLLSNAFKFTSDNKSIHLHVEYDTVARLVFIIVQDQGAGVEQNKLSEIFNLYYQANDHNDINQKGSGIGLALSKEIIELHGGQISAFINEDKGLSVKVGLLMGKDHFVGENVEFIVGNKFPATAQLPVIPEIISEDIDHKGDKVARLLLVEDNADLRTFLTGQLSRIYKVETACDGLEGLEKAQKLMPDLILSDVMMPQMGGIEMLDQLKNDVSTSHIPVVLLSAKFSIENQIEGLHYGADYYIAKPFNNDFLMAAIAGLIKQRKSLFASLVEKKEQTLIQPSAIVVTDKDKVFMEKVIRIVEQNMENTEFNIDSVAETIGLGRSTFYRKFKSLTDLAPVEFVRDMRLQRAKQYLDAGEKSISVIAYTVGFNNAKYFSTCFREKYELSPSEYLRSMSK